MGGYCLMVTAHGTAQTWAATLGAKQFKSPYRYSALIIHSLRQTDLGFARSCISICLNHVKHNEITKVDIFRSHDRQTCFSSYLFVTHYMRHSPRPGSLLTRKPGMTEGPEPGLLYISKYMFLSLSLCIYIRIYTYIYIYMCVYIYIYIHDIFLYICISLHISVPFYILFYVFSCICICCY